MYFVVFTIYIHYNTLVSIKIYNRRKKEKRTNKGPNRSLPSFGPLHLRCGTVAALLRPFGCIGMGQLLVVEEGGVWVPLGGCELRCHGEIGRAHV